MSVPFFETVDDYPKMLVKLGVCGTCFNLAIIIVIRWQIPWIDKQLVAIPLPIDFGGMKLPLTNVALAIAWATLFQILRLHDRISDVLGIRSSFDVYRILIPLANACDVPIPLLHVETLHRRRTDLMRKTFYKYASSSNPKIDKHYVASALDQWCWFWFVLESAVTMTVASIFFAVFHHFHAAYISAVVVVAFTVLLKLIYPRCASIALEEVKSIVEDYQRRNEIGDTFRAL